MLAPNAKAKNAHAAQGQNHEAFHPNRLAGKRGDEMCGESEAREHGDVDFGLREKPEQALPKNGRNIGRNRGRLAGKKIYRRKKMRTPETVRQ
jgi:hypothetical protein